MEGLLFDYFCEELDEFLVVALLIFLGLLHVIKSRNYYFKLTQQLGQTKMVFFSIE